jgi:hypothetical protein
LPPSATKAIRELNVAAISVRHAPIAARRDNEKMTSGQKK